MCADAARAALGFTDEPFPPGSHMCLLYDDDADRRRLIGSFLAAGVRTGDRVAYFVDTVTPADARSWLRELGLELPEDDQDDRFTLAAAEPTYCPEGVFVPERMLNALRDFHVGAVAGGYAGGRVSGEMSWALRGIPGSERLVEYESRVNALLVEHPVTAICQYDARRFDGTTLFEVLRVHPMMIVRGQVVRNPYYVKPRAFLDDASS